MSDYLVSIIIPVYNVEKFLIKCVLSAINQTYKNIEIILVDDGSTDNSGKICDSLLHQDSRIHVIHKCNGGLSSARNAGIEASNGQYLSFLDSDDWIEPNMIDSMLKNMLKTGTLISCCGRFDDYGDKHVEIGLCPTNEEVISAETAISKLLVWDGLDSSAVDKMFKKTLFNSIRFPEGMISEDVAIMYQVFDRARNISLIPFPFYHYCHRANSITTSSFSIKKLDIIKHSEKISKFIDKYYPNLKNKACLFQYETIVLVFDSIVDTYVSKRGDFRNYLPSLSKNMRIFFKFAKKEKKYSFRETLKTYIRFFPNIYIKIKEFFYVKNR